MTYKPTLRDFSLFDATEGKIDLAKSDHTECEQQSFEEFFQNLVAAIQELRDAFDNGHQEKVLLAVTKFDIRNSEYYNNKIVYDKFKEMDIFRCFFDLLDLKDDQIKLEGVELAEIAKDEYEIVSRILMLFLCLSKVSQNYTAVLRNFRFVNLLDRNSYSWTPEALAIGYMILSNMILDASDREVAYLIETGRCAKAMTLAEASNSQLLLAAAIRTVFGICERGTPSDIETRQGFYMSIYDGAFNLLTRACSGQYPEKTAILVQLYHLLVILTDRSMEVAKRMASTDEIETVSHAFQSDSPIIVRDCVMIMVGIITKANNEGVTGQIAARIPWQRLSRMFADDSLGWREAYLELVEKVSSNPAFIDKLIELEVYQSLIDSSESVSLPIRMAVGRFFFELMQRLNGHQTMALIEAHLYDLVLDLMDLEQPVLIMRAIEATHAAITILEREGLPVQVIASEFAKRDAVSVLKNCAECEQEGYELCKRLQLV